MLTRALLRNPKDDDDEVVDMLDSMTTASVAPSNKHKVVDTDETVVDEDAVLELPQKKKKMTMKHKDDMASDAKGKKGKKSTESASTSGKKAAASPAEPIPPPQPLGDRTNHWDDSVIDPSLLPPPVPPSQPSEPPPDMPSGNTVPIHGPNDNPNSFTVPASHPDVPLFQSPSSPVAFTPDHSLAETNAQYLDPNWPWPDWFALICHQFDELDLPDQWRMVVMYLTILEGRNSFKRGTMSETLLPQGRPQEVSYWIRCGRKAVPHHQLRDLTTLADIWCAHWKSLQLEWRGVTNLKGPISHLYRQDGDGDRDRDWGVLSIRGANGVITAITGLAFWGYSSLGGTHRQKDLWQDAVEDAKWVLQQMTHDCV